MQLGKKVKPYSRHIGCWVIVISWFRRDIFDINHAVSVGFHVLPRRINSVTVVEVHIIFWCTYASTMSVAVVVLLQCHGSYASRTKKFKVFRGQT